ncbi:hypothetical protein ZIOFF_019428 [Zingiber officinale]|uniref:Retrotransposon gag domain-containing protein n=1 Tax=Zingiber officinale TaxID=94328 RepID=A0A8J5H730_ZINOF|nr:hypothetical protein ZIOFF_019428 [Zingiber officinale]
MRDTNPITSKLEAFMERLMSQQQVFIEQITSRQQGLEEQIVEISRTVQDARRQPLHTTDNPTSAEYDPSRGSEVRPELPTSGTMAPRYSKMEFPTYSGEGDPLSWVKRCEKFFTNQRTTEADKVGLVAFHMVGEAQLWFDQVEQEEPEITWKQFRDHCHIRFGPPLSNNPLGELANLKQTDSVEDYQRKFQSHLARTSDLRPQQQCFHQGGGLLRTNWGGTTTKLNTSSGGPPLAKTRTPDISKETPPVSFFKRLTRTEMAEWRAKSFVLTVMNHTPRVTSVNACFRLKCLMMTGKLEDKLSIEEGSDDVDAEVDAFVEHRYNHFSFIEDVAAARAPESLNHLLNMLQARGEALISPAAKEGLIPLVIPLSESPSGKLTSLLRWPTSPPGMEMPVVEVHKHGVWLLAKSVDQYIHRMLVEEDANVENSNKLWDASAEAGQKLYKKDDLSESGIADLDIYLLKKVGLFPDVIERKISRHLEKGDQVRNKYRAFIYEDLFHFPVSAMITGEFYTKQHFPGFGRPFAFNAQILLKVGRNLEAKDAARGALKSPWWTLGFKYQDVADIAEWEDEQIEYIKEKITEEGRMEDLKKGKAPEQVALDEAAFLMDLASIDGSWNEVVDRIAECYMEAGLHDIAKFIAFRE